MVTDFLRHPYHPLRGLLTPHHHGTALVVTPTSPAPRTSPRVAGRGHRSPAGAGPGASDHGTRDTQQRFLRLPGEGGRLGHRAPDPGLTGSGVVEHRLHQHHHNHRSHPTCISHPTHLDFAFGAWGGLRQQRLGTRHSAADFRRSNDRLRATTSLTAPGPWGTSRAPGTREHQKGRRSTYFGSPVSPVDTFYINYPGKSSIYLNTPGSEDEQRDPSCYANAPGGRRKPTSSCCLAKLAPLGRRC